MREGTVVLEREREAVAESQFRQDGLVDAALFLKVALFTAVLLGGAYAALRVLRHLGAGKEGKQPVIKHLASARISSRTSLHLVEIQGNKVLVTEGGTSVATVVLESARMESGEAS